MMKPKMPAAEENPGSEASLPPDEGVCPRCGGKNSTALDGRGALSKRGKNAMVDIAPCMQICNTCGEIFRILE